MNPQLLCRLAAVCMILGIRGGLSAAPYIPSRDDEALITVRSPLSPSEAETLRQLRRSEEASPDRLPVALTLARTLIERARATADPRCLAQARAALGPWWAQASPPVEVLLLRATIRQGLHDFGGALADLDDVLRHDPQHGQAWLTRAVVLTVRGDHARAREACLQAMRFAEPLAAITATAALGGRTGRAESAYSLLTRALNGAEPDQRELDPAQRAIRPWALVTLGELAEQTGRPAEAEHHYLAALKIAPGDPGVLAAWADLLLDQGRPSEVVQALSGFEDIDALLLRLAEAGSRWEELETDRDTGCARHAAMLRKRFAAARLRGDETHLREEARFELRIEGNVARALDLARRNWQTQRERADARILFDAAKAAGDHELISAMRDVATTPAVQAARTAAKTAP